MALSFEEQIERLTERHMALAESVEMLRDRTAETAANLDRLEKQVDRIEKQVGRIEKQGELNDRRIERLVEVTQLNFDRLTTAMLGLTEHVAGQNPESPTSRNAPGD
ncbi:MAG: hypothetical protein M3N54_06425 [Acidobacteriota bacterium]|nr:hypothetical protein [Acidobacteriota bacterium]